MSALTTQTKLLGSNAVSDPKKAYPGIVSLATNVNFAEAPLDTNSKRIAANANYDLMEIPVGFVVVNVVIKELAFGRGGEERAASGTITLKTKSDSATIGSAYTIGSTNVAAKSIMAPGAPVTAKDTAGTGTVTVPGANKAYPSGDWLCFVSNADQANGGIGVIVTGFFPDPEDTRYSPTRSVEWRKVGNDKRNVANSDRLLGQ